MKYCLTWDIPVRTNKYQIMLFDWPYTIIKIKVWKLMSNKSFFSRKIKLFFFKLLLKYVNLMLAQTDVAKKRLYRFYKLKNIEIFPNSVAIDHFKNNKITIDRLSSKFNLLCLSAYYTHKNLEIFIKLGRHIKQQNIDAEIFLTIDKNKVKEQKLLHNLEESNLQGVITNLGSIKLKDVPSLYQSVDGLILPTLLESFFRNLC